MSESKCEECPICVKELEGKVGELEKKVKTAYEAGKLMCDCSELKPEMPLGCEKCQSTLPCEDTCGAPKREQGVVGLLPCPFCGCEAHHFEWSEVADTVECMNPDCHVSIISNGNSSEKWNTRATPTQSEPKRDQGAGDYDRLRRNVMRAIYDRISASTSNFYHIDMTSLCDAVVEAVKISLPPTQSE